MKVYCEGRRSYNTSFKIDIHVTHSETSRFTVIRKALLQPGTEFTVYVTAFTRMGEGARSESVVVNTPSTGESFVYSLIYSQKLSSVPDDILRGVVNRSELCQPCDAL